MDYNVCKSQCDTGGFPTEISGNFLQCHLQKDFYKNNSGILLSPTTLAIVSILQQT